MLFFCRILLKGGCTVACESLFCVEGLKLQKFTLILPLLRIAATVRCAERLSRLLALFRGFVGFTSASLHIMPALSASWQDFFWNSLNQRVSFLALPPCRFRCVAFARITRWHAFCVLCCVRPADLRTTALSC